jgi:glycine cleavage system H protein
VSRPGADDESSRVFMMGEFRAVFPSGLRYTTNHMWAAESPTDGPGAAVWRFGLTSYAVRLLQDVYFLDWVVDPPTMITRRQQLGSIESKKAESDLYSPTAGELIGYNQQALSDPSVVNVDIYGGGWLLEIAPQDSEDLLDVDAYLKHLEQAWVVAQRTIKGQVG